MTSGADLLRLYDSSSPTNIPILLDRKPWPLGTNNPAFTGTAAFAGTNRLYALDSDNGIVAFSIAAVGTNPLTPLIYLQPTNLAVSAGSPASFFAAADGTGPLGYQWRLENQNIAGATASVFSIGSAQASNTGAYSLLVTNAFGSVTSTVATLTVTGTTMPPPLIAYEPFNYAANSSLVGQGGWLLNSGSGGTIQAGNLPGVGSVSGNNFGWTSSSMSVRLPVGVNTNGALYFSFALRVSSVGTAASDTLGGFTTGTSTTYLPKINISSNSVGAYNLAVYKGTGTTTGSMATNVFTTNDIVFLVARYTFNSGSTNDDTCDLWLNSPASTFGAANPPPPTIADVGLGAGKADSAQIDRFSFRSAAPALQSEADELRVGTSWAAVTPPEIPALGITLSGNVATLRWSTNAAGFLLEQSATFSNGWTANSNPVIVTGGSNIATIVATNGARFYRLRR